MTTLRTIALVFALSIAAQAAPEVPAAPPPTELIQIIQQADPSLVRFDRFWSIRINNELSLWMVFGSPAQPAKTDAMIYPQTERVLCLVIAKNEHAAFIVDRLVTEQRPKKGYLNLTGYHVDSLSNEQVTLVQDDDFYGYPEKKLKIFFDTTLQKVLGKQELGFFAVRAVATQAKTVWAAASFSTVDSNHERQSQYLLRTTFPLVDAKPELFSRIADQPIPRLEVVTQREDQLVFEGAEHRCILRGGEWRMEPKQGATATVKVALSSMFQDDPQEVELSLDQAFTSDALPKGQRAIVHPGGVVIVDADSKPTVYVPPPFAMELFKEKRKDIIRNASPEYPFHLKNYIGAWQLVDNEIVFGTDFYDGEGSSGIGAIGYFDLMVRTYRFEFLDELDPWSTSALLADGETLWIATKAEPEGKSYSGGILRYDRKKKSVKRCPVPHVALTLARHGDYLLIGTEEGLYIQSPDQLFRIGATVALDGTPRAYRATVPQPDRLSKAPTYSLEY